jgi:hypothetical protein
MCPKFLGRKSLVSLSETIANGRGFLEWANDG